MQAEAFQPKIVAFCCHYCAYSSADLAGSMRIQYPPNVRIIRTPCTGRPRTLTCRDEYSKSTCPVVFR